MEMECSEQTPILLIELEEAGDADDILRVIDGHEDLLAALYGTLGIVENVYEADAFAFNGDLPDLITEARAAIAKAIGQ